MKIRLLLVLLFAFILLQAGYSQRTDFGIWYGLNANYSITKKIELDLSGSLRTYSDARQFEQYYFEGGISYKFNKYLSASGTYRLTKKIEDNSLFYIRHKLFADIKGTLPAGKLLFSSRLRFQYQSKTFIEDESDKIPDYLLRVKLKALYKFTQFPVNPYLYYEPFFPLFSNSDSFRIKERFCAGFNLKITRKHSVELEYIFERDYEPRLAYLNVISMNYYYKF